MAGPCYQAVRWSPCLSASTIKSDNSCAELLRKLLGAPSRELPTQEAEAPISLCICVAPTPNLVQSMTWQMANAALT